MNYTFSFYGVIPEIDTLAALKRFREDGCPGAALEPYVYLDANNVMHSNQCTLHKTGKREPVSVNKILDDNLRFCDAPGCYENMRASRGQRDLAPTVFYYYIFQEMKDLLKEFSLTREKGLSVLDFCRFLNTFKEMVGRESPNHKWAYTEVYKPLVDFLGEPLNSLELARMASAIKLIQNQNNFKGSSFERTAKALDEATAAEPQSFIAVSWTLRGFFNFYKLMPHTLINYDTVRHSIEKTVKEAKKEIAYNGNLYAEEEAVDDVDILDALFLFFKKAAAEDRFLGVGLTAAVKMMETPGVELIARSKPLTTAEIEMLEGLRNSYDDVNELFDAVSAL